MSEDLYDEIDQIDELLFEGEFEEAASQLSDARESFGDEPELRVLAAEIPYEMGDWETCIERVDEEIDGVSDDFAAELLGFKGYSLFYLDREEEARRAFNEAVAANSEVWMALVGRAMIQQHLGFNRAALLDLDRAIEIDDQEAEPFALRGQANLELGEYAAAVRDFGYVLDIDPDDEESRLQRARILALSDRASEAIETLEPLVEDGEEPDYLLPGALLRSQMSLQLGSIDAAAEDAETAIEAAPDQPWGYLQLAAVRLRASKPGESIAELKKADERVGSEYLPDIPALRAAAYDQLGKEEKADQNRREAEGAPHLPGVVYGPELNPAESAPADPQQPVDIHTLMTEIFGDPDNAPPGYEQKLRDVIDQIGDVARENPGAEQLEIELPPLQDGGESPGSIVLELE